MYIISFCVTHYLCHSFIQFALHFSKLFSSHSYAHSQTIRNTTTLFVYVFFNRTGGIGTLELQGFNAITGASPGSNVMLNVPTASTVVYLGMSV